MSDQIELEKSDLLVEIVTEEQELLSGGYYGYGYGGRPYGYGYGGYRPYYGHHHHHHRPHHWRRW